MIDGQTLREWRTSHNLTQDQVAMLIEESLGTTVAKNTVSSWETGKTSIGDDNVAVFLETLIETPDEELPEPPPRRRRERSADSAPGGPDNGAAFKPGPGYAKACEELWGVVAMGFTGWGMLFRQPVWVDDGAIIDARKRELGEAWGQAAQTNPTLQRWITGLAEGGVWLQVSLVTGQVAGVMVQNHAAHRRARQAAQAPQAAFTDGAAPVEQPAYDGYEEREEVS